MKIREFLVVISVVVALTGCGVGGGEKRVFTPSEHRDFGVVMEPVHFDNWVEAVGAVPAMTMSFEAWSKNRTYEDRFRQVRELGLDSYLVTWEPWKPAARGLKIQDQAASQSGYTNADVASGRHDAYIRRWAKSVKDSGLKTVYMRYAHEMNGDWFPWYHDPENYVRAWRHVVDIFRMEGATNAKWTWSLNPSLYQDDVSWLMNARKYWPGSDYVDYVGSTMISFGGQRCEKLPCGFKQKDYPVNLFAQRIAFARASFKKDVVVTEANTDYDGRLKWLRDLQRWVETTPWVRAVVLSQAPSRAAAAKIGSGKLSWQVETDQDSWHIVQDLANTMRSTG